MAARVMPFSIPMAPLKVDGFAWYPFSVELQRYLQFKSRFGTEVELGQVSQCGTFIAVPRAICPEPEQNRDFRVQGIHTPSHMLPSWTPRENQLDLLPQIDALVRAQESFILQAGTGIGKTVLSMLLITGHQTTTLIIVDQENIQRQWRNTILKCTDILEHEIGYIQGDTCDVQGKKVVIAMLQSVHKKGRYPSWVYRHFGMIIFDECHILGAAEFSKVCGLFPARIRIGLTATPKRQDGLEKIFISHIGPIRIKKEAVPLLPKVLMVATPYQLPVVTRRDHMTEEIVRVKLPHQAGRLMSVFKDMANSDARNLFIAQLAKQAYDAGRNVVLFTDLKDEHHTQLEHWLGYVGIPLGDIGRYTGGLSEEQQDYNSGKRCVLATYKATSKAVDCPWWDTAIMVTPHSDVAQIVGRILRSHPMKQCISAFGTENWNADPAIKVPVVFDLVDMDSNILQGYFKARLGYYQKIGAVMAGDVTLPARVGYNRGGLRYAPKQQ